MDNISYWYLIAILFSITIFTIRLKKTSVPKEDSGAVLLDISRPFVFNLILVLDILIIVVNIVFIIIQLNQQSPDQGAVMHRILLHIIFILMFLFNFMLIMRKNKLCENGIVSEDGLIRWNKIVFYTRISDARIKFTFRIERISMNWNLTLHHSKHQKEEIDQILKQYIIKIEPSE